MTLNFSSPLKATLTMRPRHGFMGNGTQKCQRDMRGEERISDAHSSDPITTDQRPAAEKGEETGSGPSSW